jgi:hypothetical protein
MPDEQDQDQLRRFGRRDRKTRLTSGPLFPADDSPLPDDAELAADTSAIIDGGLSEPLDVPERFPPVRPKLDDRQERPRRPARRQPVLRRRGGNWRHNLIAFLFFVGTLALCGVYAIIWSNPWSPLNPLAPPTEFYFVTETPDPLGAMNATATAAAMVTPTPVAGLESFSGLPFSLEESGVIYMPSSSSCDWASIAGTVTGLNGEPLSGYRISIIDALEPDSLNIEVFSGAVQTFGAGGFEYVLGSVPREGRYDIQLFNPVGVPLSDVYRIVTRDTCDQNVAVVNFVQTAPM